MGSRERGVVAQHVARALEMKTALARAIEILDELDTSAPGQGQSLMRGEQENLVWVQLKVQGDLTSTWPRLETVRSSSTVHLSQQPGNIPTMGPATEGFHHEYGPHVIPRIRPLLYPTRHPRDGC